MTRLRMIVAFMCVCHSSFASSQNQIRALASEVRLEISNSGYIEMQVAASGGFPPDSYLDRLKSGLTTDVLTTGTLVEVSNDGSAIRKYEAVETMKIRFDLWEESFEIRSTQKTWHVQSVSAAAEAIRHPEPLRIIRASEITPNARFQAIFVQVLNPLDKELYRRVFDWSLSREAALRGGATPGSADAAGSRPSGIFTTLFNRAWKLSLEGELLAGEIRREVRSPLLNIQQLKSSGRRQ